MATKIKHFLLTSKDIYKASFIWNMSGSMLNAFQSVIMLMILTRTGSLLEAGIYTIAYANANLFLMIGKYGMRNFQVSDVEEQFTFTEYRYSRYITSFLMLIASVAYTIYSSQTNAYTSDKSLCIIWMCLFKLIDSLEDVYHGRYQQKGRLDISGKCMTLRMIITIIIFALSVIILHSLLPALIISTVSTAIIFIFFTTLTCTDFKCPDCIINKKNIFLILKVCLPLFLGNFLSFYIGNAPKYAIDSILNDELQACYGFIAMPVFVIGLLNNFIFNPIVAKMSFMWNEKNIKSFKKLLLIQMTIIFAITAICEIGAYLIGIPVLSIMYNTDLTPYKTELLILLMGGGFLALSGLFVTIITIMRLQKMLLWGYGVVSILAYIASPIMIERYNISGATILYLFLMIILCIIFIVPLLYGIKKETHNKTEYKKQN